MTDDRDRDYRDLQQMVKNAGLLEKQPGYYTLKIVSTLGLLIGAIIAVPLLADNFWLLMASSAYMAFAFGQIGYVGHDAGHRAIFRSARGNEIASLVASFLLGMSPSWWITAHNQHHSTPNDLDDDPHTALPFMAFSPEKAQQKRGFMRWFLRYQHLYYWAILPLESIGLRLASVKFLIKPSGKVRHQVLEPALMISHVAVYVGVLWWCGLSMTYATAFVAVHQGLFGLYYGMVFAPNHKGMLIPDKKNPLGFLRAQVLTTRNIKPGMITDLWYGGLNLQIEHHLFPNMPRNNFGKARLLIRAFCDARKIPYHETSVAQSFREIIASLREAGNSVRRPLALSRSGEQGD